MPTSGDSAYSTSNDFPYSSSILFRDPTSPGRFPSGNQLLRKLGEPRARADDAPASRAAVIQLTGGALLDVSGSTWISSSSSHDNMSSWNSVVSSKAGGTRCPARTSRAPLHASPGTCGRPRRARRATPVATSASSNCLLCRRGPAPTSTAEIWVHPSMRTPLAAKRFP